jgi:penicillin-binding protein 2
MDAPEIAIGVIVENGGHGGSTAGPIAAAILRTYFRKTGRLPKDSMATNSVMRKVDLMPSNDR